MRPRQDGAGHGGSAISSLRAWSLSYFEHNPSENLLVWLWDWARICRQEIPSDYFVEGPSRGNVLIFLYIVHPGGKYGVSYIWNLAAQFAQAHILLPRCLQDGHPLFGIDGSGVINLIIVNLYHHCVWRGFPFIVALLSGPPDPLALGPGHRSVIRPAAPRGIDPRVLPQEGRDEIEDIHLGLPKSD